MLQPDNIPARFYPLPEGCALLGQGGHIPNSGDGRLDHGYTINSQVLGDEWDSWTEVDDFNLEEEDGLCYAVPLNHPLLEANREWVEQLNPGVVFPWMIEEAAEDAPEDTPFTPIDPSCTAMRRFRDDYAPQSYVIIGNASEVIWPQPVGLFDVRFAAYTGAFISIRNTVHYGGMVIAPRDHPLVEANRAAVEFHNPELRATPETNNPPRPFNPVRPLPDNVPAPPEGYVMVGWGRPEFGGCSEHGFILRGLNHGETQPAHWDGPNMWGYSDPSYCFAVPADGPLAAEYPEIVTCYQALSNLGRGNAPTPNLDFAPLPAGMPPIPAGHVLLGWGGVHLNRASNGIEGLGYGWSPELSSGWSGPSTWSLSDPNFIWAYPTGSEIVRLNPEVVAFYDPQEPAQDTTPILVLPPGVPTLPPEAVYLGVGGSFDRGPRNFSGWFFNPAEHTRWIEGDSVGGMRTDIHYAVARNSHLLELNPAFATIRNTPTTVVSASAGVPLEEGIPPLPDGYIHIGRGGSFATGGRGFSGLSVNTLLSTREWRNGTDWSGGSESRCYAVTADSPILDLNPHLRASAPEPVSATQEPAVFGKRQWLLTLNGAPVSSFDELKALCEPLMSKPENLQQLTTDLWLALEYDDPESRIENWSTREPLLLMVDFVPDRSETDVLIPTIAESSKSIGEIITTAAAGVLLRGGLSNHFNYTEEGRLIINPANPPDLEQGCEILRRTLEVRETGQKLDNYSAWTLGMLGDELERFFGNDFDPSLVMEATGRCYNTYITSLKVYRELWANRRNLSFTHHKEALYAKIPMDDTIFVLDTADRLRLSVAQQRKLVSFVRLYGRASLEADPPQESELLMERLEVKSVNRNFLFFLRSENRWFKYRGPFEHIPNGATPIINADTRAVLDATGSPTEMAEWTPVGIEVPHLRGHAVLLEAEREAAAEAEQLESTQEAADAQDSIEEEVP